MALTLKDDTEGQKTLAVILSQCFDTMKLYGRDAGQMASAAALFKFALADYPAEKIQSAFAFYLRNYSEMPTPADIANIIRRGNKPPLDRTVYVRISRIDPQDRSRSDWEYINEYEEFQRHGEFQ